MHFKSCNISKLRNFVIQTFHTNIMTEVHTSEVQSESFFIKKGKCRKNCLFYLNNFQQIILSYLKSKKSTSFAVMKFNLCPNHITFTQRRIRIRIIEFRDTDRLEFWILKAGKQPRFSRNFKQCTTSKPLLRFTYLMFLPISNPSRGSVT